MHNKRAISFNWRAVKLFIQKGKNEKMDKGARSKSSVPVFSCDGCAQFFFSSFWLISKLKEKLKGILSHPKC